MPLNLEQDFPMRQIVDADGQMVGAMPELQADQLRQLYRRMLTLRIFDQRAWNLQRQGRIGTYPPFSGHEAVQVGSAVALESDDWVLGSYRDWALLVTLGVPMHYALLNAMGHPLAGKLPDGVNALPVQVVIAAQILHAVGLAWASQLQQQRRIAAAFFGDGATSQGDFHEALNLAAVKQLPVVFVCENNQWAISVPVTAQTHSRTIAQKAWAYDIRGVRVDGNDVLAVYATMKEVVAEVRAGQGPVLVEAVTYRLGAHTTSDDPTRYRPTEQEQRWLAGEPVARYRRFLLKQQLLTEAEDAAWEQAARDEVEQAVQMAEKVPAPDPAEAIFDQVYGDMPTLLRRERGQLEERMKRASWPN